jgi:hypothetical protein
MADLYIYIYIYCHVSTSAVDTWQTVNIYTENITEVQKWFLPLNSGITYETNENSGTKFKKAKRSGTNKVFNPSIYYEKAFNILNYVYI